MNYALRREKLLAMFEIFKIEGLFITNGFNIFYLTGFRGVNPHEQEAMLWLTPQKAVLFVSALYAEEAQKITGVEIVILRNREILHKNMQQLLGENGSGNIGFESEDMKYSFYEQLLLIAEGKNWKGVKGIVSVIRLIKDAEEISLIQKAAHIADLALEKIRSLIVPGVTEKFIARKLDEAMEDLGSEKPAFDTIVASGKNSALPHYRTGPVQIENNSPVLIDFGATVEGYSSDMTRTLRVGTMSDEFERVYETVLKAQKAAIKVVAEGVTGERVHEEASLALGEYVEAFVHTIGHGVGLEIHEGPRMYWKMDDVLHEGMVITIEPGVYLPGKFGVRIEDFGVVRKESLEILSKADM